ncbi:hypothetical protein BAE46_01380 [Glaciecola punicea]|uniref:endolytic transglycosylase MltG n=1 Tax=Glaciecola punicea TaxID=56804 RepID=UPI0008720501|nr:endolytic transglycosylase MltG [Glaciecola punicea]OFA33384.1 hypothetical protein BAE46_01380 [Glaciecola punicea]
MKKIVSVFLLISLLAAIGAGMLVWQKLNSIEKLRLSIDSPTEFEVLKGKSLYKVVDKLGQFAEIDTFSFKIWLRLNPEFERIQSGVYELPPNVSLIEALDLMVKGKVKQLSITLVEGQTIAQWVTALSQAEGLSHNIPSKDVLYETLGAVNFEFCVNIYASVEGCLLPDTYFYTHGTNSTDILGRALSAMQVYLKGLWPSRLINIPLSTQYEALILASIIEKETAIESERTEIAGVFVNRLNKNMRLQTDPTVIYGIGDSYDGNITRKHLRTPTPYNTYVIRGLPITPIAMPNKASIEAALFPALTDSLYFVATGNGGHQFSTNLSDHNKAVRAYLVQRKINLTREQEKTRQ